MNENCHMCEKAYGLFTKPDVVIEEGFGEVWYLCLACSQHEIWESAYYKVIGSV